MLKKPNWHLYCFIRVFHVIYQAIDTFPVGSLFINKWLEWSIWKYHVYKILVNMIGPWKTFWALIVWIVVFFIFRVIADTIVMIPDVAKIAADHHWRLVHSAPTMFELLAFRKYSNLRGELLFFIKNDLITPWIFFISNKFILILFFKYTVCMSMLIGFVRSLCLAL